ncbi:hypothetical protein [Mitsuaria sp. GD03876]|uniref:hypothetical protein n=1 Tax=Mitsuaria sp. GD03876 TaxID=2975399 RepID=UPI002448CEC5|nr:hypothetical protein [Mitsuaria sp. GD03876]MDH0863542.1 hypothetical protein [Mitsuaria sp. GD03876]
MSRWLRLLVLTILLPAYGFAAVGVPMLATGVAQAQPAAVDVPSTAPAIDTSHDEHEADIASLLLELGDTSDDMSDHCKPDAAPMRLASPRCAPLPAPRSLEPQRSPQPPLRPPRG